MRAPATSLYLQTLALLTAYTATLALVALLAFNAQFGIGWEAIVRGPLGERFNQTIENVANDLASKPESQWGPVIAALNAKYQSNFYLFDIQRDKIIAGADEKLVLPRAVRERLNPHVAFARTITEGAASIRWKSARSMHPPSPRIAVEADRDVWLGRVIPLRVGIAHRIPYMCLVRTPHIWLSGLLLDMRSLLLTCTVVFALTLLFWLPFVYRITRRLSELTDVAQRISDGSFDTQIPVGTQDEIGQLTRAINRMSARLDRHLSGQKRLLGDIAHELVTPLARLEMAVEIAFDARDGEVPLNDIREEVVEMRQLTEELLAFAKAGLRGRDIALAPCAVASSIEEICGRLQLGARVETTIHPSLQVMADQLLLSRALSNLLRNCMRYAPEGTISVSASRGSGNDNVLIEINDEGPGVAEELIRYFGEPFLRSDLSRTRESGGFGLGLSIVKTCIEACGGTVTLANRPTGGLKVTLSLRSVADDEDFVYNIRRVSNAAAQP